MNKYKKIAVAVVSTVMAGTLTFSIAGCKPKEDENPKGTGNDFDYSIYDKEPTLAEALKPSVDSNGKLTYDDNTVLNMNVGNQGGEWQSIAYQAHELSGTVTMPDGKSYKAGDLKPAWATLKETLKIDFVDKFQNQKSNEQITNPITSNKLTDYDVITGSLQAIVENSTHFLNLNDYVYYMPNYKAFLKSQSVSQYSLTATAVGDNRGAMYAAPYYDGNGDIEKYELVNRNWVKIILDGSDVSAATTTFKDNGTQKSITGAGTAYAESFMGKTGKWTVATSNPSDPTNPNATINVTVDYDAALSAAKNADSELGKALTAAGVTNLSALASGNIVDLQNEAIKATAGNVTGAQLIGILREYIKVAYKDGNDAIYNGKTYGSVTTKLSDVFNSSYAAWDADLLTATLRCVVTGINLFDEATKTAGLSKLWGLAARQGTTQRRVDLGALAGELYGVRGMESRSEYLYFEADGTIKNTRLDPSSYELVSKMSALAKEGLLYTATVAKETVSTYGGGVQTFMMHDYAQTQTSRGVVIETDIDKYNFAPILTPVSKWDTDGDGNRTDIMRFTESWRSVKNTGFCIPVESVRGNAKKLSAVLTFIDHLFSNDGQILMTYGAPSANDTTPDGWWYNAKSSKSLSEVAEEYVDATNRTVKQYKVKDEYKKQVFVYNGEVYEGLDYAYRCVPKMTTASSNFYHGETVNGFKMGEGNLASLKGVGNYTNYARKAIGTTLPIGNKDQGFEYQATAACALDGSAIVNNAILSKTIKHVELVVDGSQTAWYMIVPTAFPLSQNDQAALKSTEQTLISGTYFLNDSKTDQVTNIYIDLLYNGLGANVGICGQESSYGTLKETGAEYVEFLGQNMVTRHNFFVDGWTMLKNYYKIK